MTNLLSARTLLVRTYQSDWFVAMLCAMWLGGSAPFVPELFSSANLESIFISVLPLLILAVGQTLVLIVGGIDLSVTATIGLASVVGAFAMNGDTGWLAGTSIAAFAGTILMLIVGAGVGLLNGLAISLARMPAFMVTLTSLMFMSGLAVWLTQSRPINYLPAAFTAIGANPWNAGAVTLTAALIAHAVLARTLLGRWLYAVGHNPRVALIAGVPVGRVLMLVYVFSGICAALAAILYTGRLETASPVTGQRMLLDVIGATVIGGTSLYGGRGRVIGTVLGALFLTLIDNSLNLLNLSHFAIMMVKGVVILLAAWLDTRRHRGSAA